MTYTTRAAIPSDIPAILELWTTAEVHPSHTDDAEGLARLLDHDPDAVIVAEGDGPIIGSVVGGWDGWRGSVYRLAVAPAHRRRGVGTRLVTAAVARLQGLGARRLQAIVVGEDQPAVSFWRATDWEEQVQRLRFVKG
jgi:ribosomal protein S18 acetylase RimI-like enzyme